MLLTGFDSKYLNTLYVDKNLKHHGLIQAFSRTNRVLNDTKPYGNILDFRAQEKAVDDAIALFSGEDVSRSREIWLVDPAPKVIEKLDAAVAQLETFMQTHGQPCTPEAVNNLKGDVARAEFINRFKEVQRLKTQLDQYTDLTDEQQAQIEQRLPEETHRGFRGMYLETAQRLREQQRKPGDNDEQKAIEQLEFEFVLFSSALIDYDYIMGLVARFSQEKPGKQTMSREQLINLLSANSNLHGRARRHHRLHQHPASRPGPERGQHPRRLPGVPGAEGRGRADRHRRQARARARGAARLRRRHPGPA